MEARIIELFNQGFSYNEIGKIVGTSKENVRYHLSKHDLKRGYVTSYKTVTCEQCGVEFEQKSLTQRFCSNKCYTKYYYALKHPKKEKPVKAAKTPKIKYCVQCNKLMTNDKFGKRKFCSNECRDTHMRENPRHTKVCPICGKEFKTNIKKQKTCSKSCGTKLETSGTFKPGSNQNGTQEVREKKFSTSFNKQYANRWQYLKGFTNTDSSIVIKCLQCGVTKEINAMSLRKKFPIACQCELDARKEHKREELRVQRYKEYIEKSISKIKVYKRKALKKQTCAYCGGSFEDTRLKKFCSPECVKKSNDYHKSARRREKIKTNGHYDWSISIPKLIKRDKVCKLCGKPVDIHDRVNAKGTVIVGVNYPSIDHIIPVSKGGTHTWDNVQLAHVGCNAKKSDTTDVVARVGKIQLSLNV